MRTAIVALLALVAIAAAGLWGLAQFGAPRPMVAEEHAPVARIAASPATAPLAPPQHEPGAAHPNASDTLKTEKPKADAARPAAPKPDASKPDASKNVVVAEAAPAPRPEAAPAAAPAPAPAATPTTTTTEAAPSPADAKPADALKTAAKKAIEEKLRSAAPPTAAATTSATLSPGFSAAPTAASAPPPPAATPAPAPAATPPPPPAATPAAPDNVQTASAPKPATTPVSAAAAAPAAASAGPASLAEQFKTRKVAYNRPPSILYLDRPIDISLVIDATAAADPAAQLQGFPGQVVERDVSLSDAVSARLTGVGFDIASQNPGAERQVLSSHTPNRWQWRVTPTEPGTHTLMLDIFGYKTNSLDAEPLDAYRDQITVEVRQLDSVIKWARGIQPLFAVIAAIAGLLSALIAVLRFRRDGKKSG
jgi:hypothetical protein